MVLRTKGFDEKSNLGRLFIGFSHISNPNIQLYLEGMQLATRDALPGSLRIIVRLPSDGGPPACCQPGPRPTRGPIAPRLAGGWQMDDCIWHYFELLGPCWRHLSTHP
jgi:hypothetical protein